MEGNAGPAPVVDVRGDAGEGFHVAAFRRLIGLCRLAVDGAGGIAAAHAVAGGMLGVEGAQGAQHLDLLVADAVGFERSRRFHRHQAQQLQDMALHHVTQGAGACVVRVAAVHAFALCDQDVHRLDVVAVPHRLQQGVAEAQGDQVLNRSLAQIVIQAEHAVFVDPLADGADDLFGTFAVAADRFLQHQPGRCGEGAPLGQAFAGGDVQARRNGQVAHAPAVHQVGDGGGDRVDIAQVHRTVVDAAQQRGDVVLRGHRHGLLQARAQDVMEGLGVMAGQGQRTDAEILRQQTIAKQAQQRREQVALGQITCGTEQEEGVVHRSSFRSG